MTMLDGECGCCHRQATTDNPLAGVASSSIAPYSLSFCVACLRAHAEPAELISFMSDDMLGSDFHPYWWLVTVWDPVHQEYVEFHEYRGRRVWSG